MIKLSAERCWFHIFWVKYAHSAAFLIALLAGLMGVFLEGKPISDLLHATIFMIFLFALCQWYWAWVLPLEIILSKTELQTIGAFGIKRSILLVKLRTIVYERKMSCTLFTGLFPTLIVNGNMSNQK